GVAKLVSEATSVRFDGSDLMPGEVGAGSFWTGMTDYFSGTADADTVLAEIDASWPAGGEAEEVEEEAAVGEKVPLTLYYMPVTRFYYPSPKEIAEGMAADLANAGFDVQLELAGDWPTYLGLRREGKLDGLYMLGWGGDNGDPDNFLNYFFGFASADKVGDDPAAWVKSPEAREGWYANTDIAYLLYQASINPDQAARQAMYEEVEQMLHDDIARIWIAHNNTPLVFSSAVEGYVPQPVGADYFEGVTVEGADTFIFGRGGDSVQLDPAIVTDGESFRVTGQVLEPLYQYEPGSTTPIPALAEECTANEDSTEWTCTLRQGVKFHDGTDFNADAVIFNYDRWRYTDNAYHFESQVFEYYEYMWGGFDDNSVIASVEKVDDYTVKFVLTDSLAPFLANLAMDMFAISSPAAIEAAGEDYGLPSNGAVGTGPFKFVEWVEGDHITIEANADYWGGAPSVSEIIFRVIADDSARFLALQAGDIQGLEQAVVEDLGAAEAADDLYVQTRPALNTGYLAFSYRIVEFQDPLVREAFAHAINREGLVENFYGAYGEAATNFLPPLIWGHNDAVEDWTYDPDLSMQLLAEAGFPDGLSEVTIDPNITPAE
ncbi:MAG: ABC transporter substrate-binding protein, partial [Chloroflexota bacterium]|nr:ABC transporter substrate-binding protein [Chloroflexota bacterium]